MEFSNPFERFMPILHVAISLTQEATGLSVVYHDVLECASCFNSSWHMVLLQLEAALTATPHRYHATGEPTCFWRCA